MIRSNGCWRVGCVAWLALAGLLCSGSRPVAQDGVSDVVAHWSAADAFAKGPLILDRMDASQYQLFAVQRDKPGAIEFHATDTDLVLVLEGAATFVTGGTIVKRRELRANEASGEDIHGGDARRLEAGDAIIVPNGTPHWFRDVSPSIRYFAVKLRQPSAGVAIPIEVRHWKASEIFAKGGPLFTSDQGTFLKLYGIRRDKPLGVELHHVDTDVVFVTGGTGTFVTAGAIADARSIGPNESSGTSIQDGSLRPLVKGDVLVLPRGVPHWLRDIDGQIDFFAVKVH